MNISRRIPEAYQATAWREFEAVRVLAIEIRETRKIIESKLNDQKFLNAAMHAELLALLIRRFDSTVSGFLAALKPIETKDLDVPETFFSEET